MTFHPKKTALFVAVSMALFLTGCSSDNDDDPIPPPDPGAFVKPSIYAGFPVTLTNAPGDHTHSVAYTGQMTRQVMRESVKAFMSSPEGLVGAAAADRLTEIIHNPNKVLDDQNIIAPVSTGNFIIKEIRFNDIGGGNLISKMASSSQLATPMAGAPADDVVMGVPGNKTAAETIDLWIANFAATTTAAAADATLRPYTDMTTGYDYRQLILKYMLTGLFYSQAVDKYFDDYVTTPGTKDNSLPYNDKAGTHYTGKEHSWDEGFGYFGASANFGENTPANNRLINQRGGKSATEAEQTAMLNLADWDNDDKVSLYTEYPSGPANFAALFDTLGGSYSADIMDAMLSGRTLIANAVDADGNARNLTDAERVTLVDYAKTITLEWEKVNAEAAHRYAGLSHVQMQRILNETGTTSTGAEGTGSPEEMHTATLQYYKFWGELKGFMIGMQHGGPVAKMDKAEFDALQALVGYGPVLQDGSRVSGVSGTGFTMSAADAAAFAAYIPNMKTIQGRLHDFYTLAARQHLIP